VQRGRSEVFMMGLLATLQHPCNLRKPTDPQNIRLLRAAAEQRYMNAQHVMGIKYDKGECGLAEDQEEAARWYERAAALGHDVAQRCLGDMYVFGDGVDRSYMLASEWLEKAALQGDAEAQFKLGNLHREHAGEGTLSIPSAVRWYKAAAELGHSKAQNNYAHHIWAGDTMEPTERALHWWGVAAEAGHAGAQYSLASLYLEP
jgi:hypothetical protein